MLAWSCFVWSCFVYYQPTRLSPRPGLLLLAARGEGVDEVVREFHESLAREPEGAVAVAAINALTNVLIRSTATTMMGVQKELNDAAASLQRS